MARNMVVFGVVSAILVAGGISIALITGHPEAIWIAGGAIALSVISAWAYLRGNADASDTDRIREDLIRMRQRTRLEDPGQE